MMGMMFETKGKKPVDVRYVNDPIPGVVEENFGGLYHDHDGLSLTEFIQHQEGVYQSLQRSAQIDKAKASSSSSSRENHELGRKEGAPSVDVETQLAIDEALARELLEWELTSPSLSHTLGRETVPTKEPSRVNAGQASPNTSQVVRQDDVDPENMTYEELQSLGEAIGTESRGLPDDVISFLPTETYKTGFFSRKEKHEECVICCVPYKNRDKLIRLPCMHHYHSSCVTRWLKMRKVCPVCNEEVFGS